MTSVSEQVTSHPRQAGLQITPLAPAQIAAQTRALEDLLQAHGLRDAVQTSHHVDGYKATLSVQLRPDTFSAWTPDHNTLELHSRLQDRPSSSTDIVEQQILVALLASPCGFTFPDTQALASHIRIRRNIVVAARKTALAFKTEAAERPEQFWRYDEEHGFTLKPGGCLIEALIAATQPEATGKLYDFSCYRATEYVILLGIAQELQTHHPALFQQLQQTCEVHAIRSGQFHDVFLIEYGSMAQPLPARYYVPGDRLWFRNPDERSSDVMGYEGSWVIYMGDGLFSNFWKRDAPYTLEAKCLEIFHWRDGVRTDVHGALQMDENVVEDRIRQTSADPEALKTVLNRMLRMRDPQGVYASGGCIDTTREYTKGVSAGHCELVLPVLS